MLGGQHPQSRRQLGEGEWLDQVIIGAGIEACHAIRHGVAGRQYQDRNLGAGRPQATAGLVAVDSGQHHVEDDGIEPVFGIHPDQRVLAGGHEVDGVALLREAAPEERNEAHLIFDHQDMHNPNTRLSP